MPAAAPSSRTAKAAGVADPGPSTKSAKLDASLPPPPIAIPPVTRIPLSLIITAPENARFDRQPEDVPALAANIAAFGLLQPLLGYQIEAPEGDGVAGFAATDGRRRLAALRQLEKDFSVLSPEARALFEIGIPVIVREHDQAAAHALAANVQRVNLGPAEAARAFNSMVINGADPAGIAKAFGVTERFVKQRLSLANLHPPILDALAAGEVSLDIAQLFAIALPARQKSVWKECGAGATAWKIKQALEKDALKAEDKLARFVGAEAYLAAGGRIEQELFKGEDESRWLDIDIAERLADAKLEGIAANTQDEGWAFVEVARDQRGHGGDLVDGALGKVRKALPAERDRLKEIDKRQATIRKQQEKLEEAPTWNPDAHDALERESDALEIEKARINESLIGFTPEARAKSGAHVSIGDDGQPRIERGLIRAKSSGKAKSATPARSSAKGGKAEPSAQPEPQDDLTNVAHEQSTRIASAIVGRAMATSPRAALVAIVAQLARDVLIADEDGPADPVGGVLDIRADNNWRSRGRQELLALLSDKDREGQRAAWRGLLAKNWANAESIIADWAETEQLSLLAFCVGERVRHIEFSAPGDKADPSRAQLALLGRLAGANPADHFTPPADFLKGMSKDALAAAGAELGLDLLKGATKPALAALIADEAKAKGWTPPLIRTLCGIEVAPAKKVTAKKVTAKAVIPDKRSAAKRDPGPSTKPAKRKSITPEGFAHAVVKKPAKKAVKKIAKKPAAKKDALHA